MRSKAEHFVAATGQLAIALLLLEVSCFRATANDEAALWRALASGGHVALMRHATAPGYGDPASFTIGDCTTQRNLSEEGRAQAKRMGEAFRANGAGNVRVYSSQWCRCMDTAEQLGLGPVEELPALNSLHGHAQNAGPQLKAFSQFLAGQPREGPSLVLVSHHATIARFVGAGTASGAVVVARRDGAGGLEVLGTLPAR